MKRQIAATGLTILLAASAVKCSHDRAPLKNKEASAEGILSKNMNSRLAKRLAKKLRNAEVNKGGVFCPLTEHEEKVLAEVLSYHYARREKGEGRQFGVPDNFQEDITLLTEIMGRGFNMEKAEEILSEIKLAFNSRELQATREIIIPNLHGSMSDEEIRLAIEAPLFSDSGFARKRWMKTDKRLEEMLGVDSRKVSKALKERFNQEQFENAVDIISKFQRMWKEQNGNKKSPFAPGRKTRAQRHAGRHEYHRGYIREPLIHMMLSDTFAALDNAQKAEALFKLASLHARMNWGKVRPRMNAINHLEKAFRGKQPTAEQVLEKLDSYVQKHKRYRA
jgi:hypothetical protein